MGVIMSEEEYDEYEFFKKKYNRDFYTAICIKNGRMSDGSIFCIKEKEYGYIFIEEDEDDCLIRMKSEDDTSFAHAMDWKFFNDYFRKDVWKGNDTIRSSSNSSFSSSSTIADNDFIKKEEMTF